MKQLALILALLAVLPASAQSPSSTGTVLKAPISEHGRLWKVTTWPVRKTFRVCCKLGEWGERTHFTSFLNLVGAMGNTVTPVTVGLFR